MFTLPRTRFWILLLITYSILLVIGSLYPFRTWTTGRELDWGFLFASWPEKITRTDLVTNFFVYLPLGLFAARSFYRYRLTPTRWFIVCLLGALFSITMEYAQLFLQTRVASNVDVAINTLGVAWGAALAPIISSRSHFMAAIVAWRRRWFRPHWIVDAGLIVLMLWLLSQINLQAPSLLAGNLHAGFVPFWDAVAWDRFSPAKTLIFALEITALGFFISVLLHPDEKAGLRASILIVAAVLLKFATASLLIKAAVFARLLSLEVLMGIGLGLTTFLIWVWLSRRASRYPIAVGFLCALILIKLFYGVPFTTSTGLTPDLATQPGLLFNITGIAYLLSETWPYLALGSVLALWEHQS